MTGTRTRRADISVSDNMISGILSVVVHADDGDRASALRWAERRLARSSLPRDVATALLREAMGGGEPSR